MNNPIPLEYVTSFAEANQAMMQQLTTALLTSGDSGSDFVRFAEVRRYSRITSPKWAEYGWKCQWVRGPRNSRPRNQTGASLAMNGSKALTTIFSRRCI
jgi:hypothetical protein